jgi:hypothetical protein
MTTPNAGKHGHAHVRRRHGVVDRRNDLPAIPNKVDGEDAEIGSCFHNGAYVSFAQRLRNNTTLMRSFSSLLR